MMHPQRQGHPLSQSARRRESNASSQTPVCRHSSHEAFMGLGLMALMLSVISTSLEPSHSVGGGFGRAPPSFGEDANDPAASNPFPEYFRSSSSSGSGRFYRNFYRTLSPDDCGTCPVHDYAAINALLQAKLEQTARKTRKPSETGDDDEEEEQVDDAESVHSTADSLDLAAASLSDRSCHAPLDDSAGTGALTTVSSPRDSEGDESDSLFATPRSLALTPVPAVDKLVLVRAALSAVVGPHALERMTPVAMEQCERLTTALRRVLLAGSSADESTAVVPAAGASVCFPSEGRVVCVPYTSAAWVSSALQRAWKPSQSPVKEQQCDAPSARSESRATTDASSTVQEAATMQPQPSFRLFVGQLRKEVSVEFLQFLLTLMGVDVENDVVHVEMHTSAQGTRSKGCAWVDVRTEEAMARILRFHKRIFLNDSTMFDEQTPADGHTEFVVIAHEGETEWLCQQANVWSQAAGRSNDILSRNPMVVEVPKAKATSSPARAAKTAKDLPPGKSHACGNGGPDAPADRSDESSSRPITVDATTTAGAVTSSSAPTVAASRSGAPAQFYGAPVAEPRKEVDGCRRMAEAEKLYAQHLRVESDLSAAGVIRIGPATPPRDVLAGFRAPWRFDPYHRTNPRVFVAPEPADGEPDRCCAATA